MIYYHVQYVICYVYRVYCVLNGIIRHINNVIHQNLNHGVCNNDYYVVTTDIFKGFSLIDAFSVMLRVSYVSIMILQSIILGLFAFHDQRRTVE